MTYGRKTSLNPYPEEGQLTGQLLKTTQNKKNIPYITKAYFSHSLTNPNYLLIILGGNPPIPDFEHGEIPHKND